MNELINSNVIKMTSIEIAELVGSQHGNVRISIERLAKRGVIQLPPMQKVENKQTISPNKFTSVYIFEGEQGKRDSIIVVAQCRRNSPLVLLTVGENSKGQPRKYHKPFLRHCALRPTLKTRRLNWRNSLLSQHLKLSLPIALARPAEF